LNRRLRLLEDELEQSQSRLQTSQDTLHETNKLADETDRSVASWDTSRDLPVVAAAADGDDDDLINFDDDALIMGNALRVFIIA